MRIFYGWKMVGAALGLQFVQAALLNQAFGAYVATLSLDLGWSKTALSGGAALLSIEAAIIGPLLGWVVDRFGAQGMIRVGIVIFGLGFVLLSQIDTLTGFYAAVITIAIGSSLAGYFPLTVAVVQWFEKKRARALSMMSLGLALGGLAVPAVAWSMQTFGWRATAFGSGLIAVVLGFPLARLFRRSPEEMGEAIDGEPLPPSPSASAQPATTHAQPASPPAQPETARAQTEPERASAAGHAQTSVAGGIAPVLAASEQEPASALPSVDSAAATPPQRREYSAAEAVRTGAFWLLAIGHGFALLVVSAVNVHAIPHMTSDLGYSLAQASLFITMMTVAQAGGVMLGWFVGDRFEKRKVAAACMLMHAGGLLMLTFAAHPSMLVAFALLHGTAWGLRGPFMQAIRADYFGRRSIGMILGLSAALIAVGQVCGPMVAGSLADATGDYRTGFTLLAIIATGGSIAFLRAKRPT